MVKPPLSLSYILLRCVAYLLQSHIPGFAARTDERTLMHEAHARMIAPFSRLLIANRGEIAVRIARAARECGIIPLGIYSEADRNAAFLDMMEDSAPIGPPPAAQSYLAIDHILAAARTLHADAIHPGYGFLSERASFAQAVVDAGLIFVGPTPRAILAMGDKREAKRRARACGVPVVPGYDGDDQSPDALRAHAQIIGTPLLIKAAHGGGGRGLRVVHDLTTFDEALAEAKGEALAGFGDDRMLLERYLMHPRHIEFQILADAYGNTIHLGERDCSIQRRHQKIMEEAPSPTLTPQVREIMGEAAVRIARSVDYVNAGTVEFLLEGESSFFFMEMNTRLQVEHPITEEVYGIDLVSLQLRIAAGESLAMRQQDVAARGWAIEARINAEDPSRSYLPATGILTEWIPPGGPGIRFDSGVRTGSEVSISYDALLAKLIATASDRHAAIARLTQALSALRARGVATNVPLLLRIAQDPAFIAGNATTAFLEERSSFFRPDPPQEPEQAFLIALGALLTDARAWRIAGIGVPIILRGAQRKISVIASRAPTGATWHIQGDITDELTFKRNTDHISVMRGNVQVTHGNATIQGQRVEVTYGAATIGLDLDHASRAFPDSAGNTMGERKNITAPMPGKIGHIKVKAGDLVHERDLLLTLEAMKMTHHIESPYDGVVGTIYAAPGMLVASGSLLMELDFQDAPTTTS